MRFQSKTPPPGLLSRRDQRRIVLLVIGLGMILFAIKIAANPDFWRATFPEKFPQSPQERLADAAVDFDVDLGVRRPLASDEFFAKGYESTSNVDDSAQRGGNPFDIDGAGNPLRSGDVGRDSPNERIRAGTVPDGNSGQSRQSETPAERPATAEPRHSLNPDNPETLTGTLADVRDNTLGVRRNEATAWSELLNHARRVLPRDLQRGAEDQPPYTVVMAYPDRYRGKTVTLRGDLRRLSAFPAADHRIGVATLYDGWMFTADSGENPWHVVFSEAPETIPQAEAFDDPIPVEVTGYFFKREGYASRGGVHVAPLILARSLRQIPVKTTQDAGQEIVPYLFWFALAVAAALLMTIWNFVLSDWSFRRSRGHHMMQPPATPDLRDLRVTDIHEVLGEMARASAADDTHPNPV